MSMRGVQFSFEPGEYVLCFEPDLSKARVLYDAKILDQTISRGRNGKRRPEYHIHFQGWNSSWDRVVPECFVVKDTKENRALMGHLASVAKSIKSNKSRMRRIDRMLQEHFGRKLSFDSDESESDSDEDEEEMDSDKEHHKQVATEETDKKEEEEVFPQHEDEAHDQILNGMKEDEEKMKQEEEEGEQELDNKENEESMETDPSSDEQEEEVDLILPENLRKKLEDDCYFINAKKQLVNLPAAPNVVTILEGYVKNFAINILCATTEKNRPNRRDSESKAPPEKNIDLCKEVVSGLRIFFDFALPTMLLYNTEQTQLENLRTTFKSEAKSPLKQNGTTGLHSPRHRPAHTTSPAHKQEAPPTDRINEDEQEEEEEEEAPSRRITRRSMAEVKKGGESPRRERDDSGTTSQRRDSLRSRGRHNSAASPGRTSPHPAQEDKPSQPEKPVKSLPTPAQVTSCLTSTTSAPLSPTSSPPEVGFSGKEAAVNSVFSWQLLPLDDVRDPHHLLPCTVYGAHHLTRLFVKLPGLLARMQMPEEKLIPLLMHIQMVIDYLSERCGELLPDSVYMTPAGDTGPLVANVTSR